MSDPNLYTMEHLEQAIGYAFQDLNLLIRALTHRSYGPVHNERLEYLGDSILGMIIAKKLFDRFPECSEGDLTRMRSTLVRETMLAELAREFHIGDCLRLGPGELKSGGMRRQSLIADAVESIIGAMFVDSGEDYALVREIVLRWFDSRIGAIDPNVNQKDSKTELQEWLQSRHLPLPEYRIENITGADNDQTFEVSVTLEGGQCFLGKGTSRRRAEKVAASQALAYVREHAHEF